MLIISFICGLIVGLFQNRRWRGSVTVILIRKLQLIAARNENKGYRIQKKRPVLKPHQKWLLGLFHWISPTLTAYTHFKPATLISWHRRYVKRYWWLISSNGRKNKGGRPKVPDLVSETILDIKKNNLQYGYERIASIISKQLGIPVSESTVRNVLKRSSHPKHPDGQQKWKTFLHNHRAFLASMDFKVTFDWRAKPLYILSIISHHRRELKLIRSTYHPNTNWVAQQIREAFPFDEAPKMMLMDHDTIFLPIFKNTLPAMGIEVLRTAVKCPWQNGTVERFNRTLSEELLNHVIPISDKHLNHLLKNYKLFYNSSRPHRANGGEAPHNLEAANSPSYENQPNRVQAIPWLNGLHHSYKLAA